MLLGCRIDAGEEILRRAQAASLPFRREKAARLPSPEKRAASLAAGLLVRLLLRRCRIPEEGLAQGEDGALFFADRRAFLSLSHSGDYAVCALSDRPIGLDLQRIVPIGPSLPARFFTAAERRQIALSPCPETDAVALWSLKESFCKAARLPLAQALRADFSLLEGGEAVGPAGWHFCFAQTPPGYILALCEREETARPGFSPRSETKQEAAL